mgnify:CR=1 FL=1
MRAARSSKNALAGLVRRGADEQRVELGHARQVGAAQLAFGEVALYQLERRSSQLAVQARADLRQRQVSHAVFSVEPSKRVRSSARASAMRDSVVAGGRSRISERRA